MQYHIITYGCQMNRSNSERIAATLENRGYKPAVNEKQADLIVINMCSVRQSAVDRAHGRIKSLKGKKVVLTGCILEKDKEKLKNKVKIINFKELFKIKLKHKHCQGLVPVMKGCNNFCSFCVVPYTRGREYYRKKQEIIDETRSLVKKGCKEITLLGQNINSYPGFAQLLKEINDIPGNFKITFLTNNVKDFSNEIIEVMANAEKIVKYLNLPIQSGDNKILKRMNRPYTVKQYKNLIKKIRKKIPGIKLSTDIIVGFPGETKKQFQNTVKLFKEIKFNMAYISKYSPRPGTVAFKMKDDVPLEEKKEREKILREILKK